MKSIVASQKKTSISTKYQPTGSIMNRLKTIQASKAPTLATSKLKTNKRTITKLKTGKSRLNTGRSKTRQQNSSTVRFNSKKCNMFTNLKRLRNKREIGQQSNSKFMHRKKRNQKTKLDQCIAYFNEFRISK